MNQRRRHPDAGMPKCRASQVWPARSSGEVVSAVGGVVTEVTGEGRDWTAVELTPGGASVSLDRRSMAPRLRAAICKLEPPCSIRPRPA
jgi:hypothetical protein